MEKVSPLKEITNVIKSKEILTDSDVVQYPNTKKMIATLIINANNKENGANAEIQDVSDDETTPKRLIPRTLIPEAPKVSRKRELGLEPTPCICEPLKAELESNFLTATVFCSQLKHMKFHSQKKPHVSYKDILLSSEFMVGMDMVVKICMLKNQKLQMHERIILVISQGVNEVQFPAQEFITNGMAEITTNFLYASTLEGSEEIEICKSKVYATFTKELITQWVALCTYDQDYVSEKVNICAQTWVEIKNLVPQLMPCINHYFNLVMQGRATEFRARQFWKDSDDSDCSFKNLN